MKHVRLALVAVVLLFLVALVVRRAPMARTGGAVEDVPAPLAAATLLAPVEAAPDRVLAVERAKGMQPGERARVAVDYDSKTSMAQGDAPARQLLLAIDHELRLVAIDRRGSQWVLELDLAGARIDLRHDGGRVDVTKLQDAIGRKVLVLLGDDDRVLGYRFPAAFPAEYKNVVRSLFTALRAPRGEQGWRGKEGDAGGLAEVVVAAPDPATREIRWERSGYQLREGARLAPKCAGRGVATTDGAAWWSTTSYVEQVEVAMAEAQMAVRQDLQVLARRLDAGKAAVAAPADLWTRPWEPAAGDADTQAAGAKQLEQQRRELIEGVDFDELLAELEHILRSGNQQSKEWSRARRRLIELLRARPELAEKVLAMLLDPGLDRELAANLLGAAGAAGTAPMQGLLLKVAQAGLLDAERRGQALVALVQVEDPDPAAFGLLPGLFRDAGLDATVRSASLFMLGAGAGQPGADPHLLAHLLAQEQYAIENGLLDDYLAALGNAGLPEILPVAQQHLASTDPDVRAAALDALRRLETPEALELLRRHASDDPSVEVRCAAIEALHGRVGAQVLAVYEAALRDPQVAVRQTALRGLVHRDGLEVQALMRHARDNDPAQQVRDLAAELLAGE